MKPAGVGARLFDARSINARTLNGLDGEYLLIDRGGEVIRLDVVSGTTTGGPVMLHFDVANDDRLDAQIAAMRALRAIAPAGRPHVRLARRLLALQAVDARDAGASLRETADIVLGRGDWPGDGEYRKSLVRRMIKSGDRMIRTGPAGILLDRRHGKRRSHPL